MMNAADDQALGQAIVMLLYWLWRGLSLLPVPVPVLLNDERARARVDHLQLREGVMRRWRDWIDALHWARLFDWVFGLLALVAACGIIYAVTTRYGLPR